MNLVLNKDNYREYTSITSDEEFQKIHEMCIERQKLRYIKNMMSVNFSYIELDGDGFIFGIEGIV